MKWMWVTLLLLPALSGCLGDADEDCLPGTVDADGVRLVDPADLDVAALLETDAWDFQSTNMRTCSLEKIGHTPLRWDAGGQSMPHKYLGEMDMRGDLDLGVVVALGNSETPTAYLVDITDRADPQVLSSIQQTATYIVDAKISDDGDYLFLASQNLPSAAYEFPEAPLGQSTPWGFTIYDIRDRTAPVFLQTVPSPDDLGCHMISHEVIDGTDVVFCVGQNVRAHGLVRTPTGPWAYLGAFDYLLPDGSASVAGTACLNDMILVGNPTGMQCSGPHDMTVQADPVDGRTYMTVSHWNEGLRVVDVSAPVAEGFVTLGSWNGEGATHYDGNVHTAMMAWIGDTRYVIATPEMTYDGVVPSVWVLDATDLSDLRLVAEWYHPQEVPTPGLLATTHQWQVAPTGTDVDPEDVRIYLTMNHLGVWVLDFADILAGDLEGAIGGFHMSRAPLDQDQSVGNAILSTWDVNVVDGYIYGSDRATGLWVFHYVEDELGDTARTGFA